MKLDDQIKDDFPLGDKIYLNNASVSIMPKVAINSMNDFLIKYNSIGSDSISSESLVKELLIRTREIISKIINCQPDELILTQSTTDGINIVANGMLFDKNSNIIIRGGEHEHHSNYYPWLRLGKKIKLKNLSIDNYGLFEPKDLEKQLDENTKLVALSHALYNTGAILPVREIGQVLEKNKIPYFIDAAQTIGCIGNFDVKSTKCNFMSFNGSKWLCGPMGTGLFFCRRDSSSLLEPVTIGGESAMTYEKENLVFKDIPDKFQTGFRNYVGIAGLEASANYLLEYGLDNIRNKVMKLANQLIDGLEKLPNVVIYGPSNSNDRTSIVSFSLKGKDPQKIVESLENQKIILAVREIFDKKIIRASPHFFNSEQEIGTVINALKKL